MPRYAQINMETGCVVSDSNLNETSAPNLIPIAEDFDLGGKKWDFDKEDWVEYTPEPIPEPHLSAQEEIAIDTALNVEYAVCLLEAGMGLM